jgi:hypothetical protein
MQIQTKNHLYSIVSPASRRKCHFRSRQQTAWTLPASKGESTGLREDEETLDKVDLVLKTYWRETSWIRVDKIIKMATKIGENNPHITLT